MNCCDGFGDRVYSCVGDPVNRCVVGDLVNCCDILSDSVNRCDGDPCNPCAFVNR